MRNVTIELTEAQARYIKKRLDDLAYLKNQEQDNWFEMTASLTKQADVELDIFRSMYKQIRRALDDA